MSIEHEVKKQARNVRDTIDEHAHRTQAETEHEKRAVAGDVMTPGEKARSMAKEGAHRIQAGADAAKRETRDAVE